MPRKLLLCASAMTVGVLWSAPQVASQIFVDTPTPPQFGEQLPPAGRRGSQVPTASMFGDDCEDMPLFSGTPIPAVERPFVPEDHSMKQMLLPDMPPVDYDLVLEKDRAFRRRRG